MSAKEDIIGDNNDLLDRETKKRNLSFKYDNNDTNSKLNTYIKINENRFLSKETCFILRDENTIELNAPSKSIFFKSNKNMLFNFSCIFEMNTSDEIIFKRAVCECVKKLVIGCDSLILAYGVVKSGKSWLIENLIMRSLNELFNRMKIDINDAYKYMPDKFNGVKLLDSKKLEHYMDHKQKLFASWSSSNKNYNFLNDEKTNACKEVNNTKQYSIWISFYEIFNNKLYDLLQLNNNGEQYLKVIGGDESYVDGLCWVPLLNMNDAVKLYEYGRMRQQKLDNFDASCSHLIFNIKLISVSDDLMPVVSQMCFFDLAGIGLSRWKNSLKHVKEISKINESLLALTTCVNTLANNEGNRSTQLAVPYRSNKLTRLIQPYVDKKDCKIKMFSHINASIDLFEDTLHIIQFSSNFNKINSNVNCESRSDDSDKQDLLPENHSSICVRNDNKAKNNKEENFEP